VNLLSITLNYEGDFNVFKIYCSVLILSIIGPSVKSNVSFSSFYITSGDLAVAGDLTGVTGSLGLEGLLSFLTLFVS